MSEHETKTRRPFQVRFWGMFYAYGLYDAKGKECFTLEHAVETANACYGKDWREVYNGEEGASNEAV